MPFDFHDLFVFEMANNHQGRVDHGKRIIQEMGQIAKDKGIRAAIKLQFRDLDTFLQSVPPSKHIKRFLETRLSWDQFAELVDETRKHGLLTMCTPFDEPSVDKIIEMGIEVIKIGSPSNDDWPLIEKIATAGKPVIFSTGGLSTKGIDDLTTYLDSKGVEHAIMHCVSIYPTPEERFELNQIGELRRRYPDKVIGFSSHEVPGSWAPVSVAVAQGARIFEKHVGSEADGVILNDYSSSAREMGYWLDAYFMAKRICGLSGDRQVSPEEHAALRDLKRIGKAKSDPFTDILRSAGRTAKEMLETAKIALPPDAEFEFSHHYGQVMFPYAGATIVNIINREYCKKLIIMMPGQRHPSHYHVEKTETFHVLDGALDVIIEGISSTLHAGELETIERNEWHAFSSQHGAIVEEISTRHINGDSHYRAPDISKVPRDQRKTTMKVADV